MKPLLEIQKLVTNYYTEYGIVHAVDEVSFTIPRERTVGIVGESGCGKSVTAMSVMGLIQPPGKIDGGAIIYHRNGKSVDLAALDPKGGLMRSIRGNEIAMIFQEPMTSLNPVFTVGRQIMESIMLHQNLGKSEARQRAVEMLQKVGIPLADQQVDEYPHQLSGGDAAAGHDRHGSVVQPLPVDRRRAHHRPGRDHPGPGARPDDGTAGRIQDLDHDDHPRPGRRRGDGGRSHRHVPGAGGGAGPGQGHLQLPQAPLYQGAARIGPGHHFHPGNAPVDHRRGSRSFRYPQRMPVRPPVQRSLDQCNAEEPPLCEISLGIWLPAGNADRRTPT